MEYRYSMDFAVCPEDWEKAKSNILGFLFPQGEPQLTKHNTTDELVFATFSTNHDDDIGMVMFNLLPDSRKILGFSGFPD